MKNNRKLLICYIVIGLSWASTFLYTPTLSTYAASLGATGSIIGAISGGFGLTQMLCRAPAGMLSDYLGRSHSIIIAGMIAAFLAPVGMLVFPTPEGLLVFRLLSGLNAAVWPVLSTAVVSFYAREQTSLIVSRCNLVNALGNIFGMLLGGWLAGTFSQSAAFLGASLLGLASLILSLWIPEAYRGSQIKLSFRAMLQVARDKRLLFLALTVMVFQIVITGTAMTFTPVLGQSLGASAGELGVLTMLSMLGMLLASMVSIRYTRLLGGVRKAVGVSLFALAAATAAIGLCGNLYLLYVLQLLQGFEGYLVMIVLMGDSLLPYDNTRRGAASGVFQSIFAVGMFAGPILSGSFYDLMPLRSLYLLLAGISCAAAVVMLLLYPIFDAGWREKQ